MRAAFAPLTCDALWSRDRDRLGFLIQDDQVRRGVRFAPVKISILEQDDQLRKILDDIRGALIKKGFALPK